MQIERGVWVATGHVRHKCRDEGPSHNIEDKQPVLDVGGHSDVRQHAMAKGHSYLEEARVACGSMWGRGAPAWA